MKWPVAHDKDPVDGCCPTCGEELERGSYGGYVCPNTGDGHAYIIGEDPTTECNRPEGDR